MFFLLQHITNKIFNWLVYAVQSTLELIQMWVLSLNVYIFGTRLSDTKENEGSGDPASEQLPGWWLMIQAHKILQQRVNSYPDFFQGSIKDSQYPQSTGSSLGNSAHIPNIGYGNLLSL